MADATIKSMRIAILGLDPTTRELARTIAGSHATPASHSAAPADDPTSTPAPDPKHDQSATGFALTAIYDDTVDAEIARQYGCRHAPDSKWTELLEGSPVDAILVGGANWPEQRLEQLKQFLQSEIPVMVSWPHGDPLTVFELDMVRQSYGGLLTAVAPLGHHPAVEQLAALADAPDGPLGTIEQLVLERQLPDRSQTTVLARMSEDVDMLRRIVGHFTQVTATGVVADSESWGNLVVQGQSSQSVPVRWIVPHAAQPWSFRLSLIGSKAQAIWECSLNEHESRLFCMAVPSGSPSPPDQTNHEHLSRSWRDWPWPRVVLAQFAAAVHGAPPDPSWTEVCRASEIVDATQRSVARGRRIDLTGQTVTEKDAFRGVMSATGCFLLLACMLVVLGLAVVEGFRLANLGTYTGSTGSGSSAGSVSSGSNPMPGSGSAAPMPSAPESASRPTPYWAIVLAVPLVGFLFLQLLQLVIRRPKVDSAGREDPRG